jgi:hypothetical protein
LVNKTGELPILMFVIKKTMNITIKGKLQQSEQLYKPVNMNDIFANYL